MSNEKHRTWLVWDKMTGVLKLEVQEVPVSVTARNLELTLAGFRYWPVSPVNGPESVANDYVAVAEAEYAPGPVVEQMKEAVTHIRWRGMWQELMQL